MLVFESSVLEVLLGCSDLYLKRIIKDLVHEILEKVRKILCEKLEFL